MELWVAFESKQFLYCLPNDLAVYELHFLKSGIWSYD